jgi:8-oxo-dGTP pyrophosphatase MutT (NUDIX family)
VHSVAMSVGIRKLREICTPTVEPSLRSERPLRSVVQTSLVQTSLVRTSVVRLSQLRKLRECEQVAAVCYRVRRGDIEFLLVRTRGGSGHWTFPKGSAEPGLTPAQAAALEAFEEAGVHGRIEEASFTNYARRTRGSERKSAAKSTKKSAKKSGKKELIVNAHLCEVLRLGPAQESNRNRTWFSVADARQSLREGRKSEDGAEFVRVVDRAVARIQRLREAMVTVDDQAQRDRFRADAPQKDALQRVKFDFAEAYASAEASVAPYGRRQPGGMRRFALPSVEVHPRTVLPCEVLQFGSARERKAKALGAGTNLRS